MRDIQQVLERWGGWAASENTAISWSPVAAGFKGLLPATPARPRPSCSDDDGLTIDACVCRLRAVRASGELNVIMAYYVWGMSKRAIGRALRTSEGRVRQQLQVAEGFVAGCLEMTGARLEMDAETGAARIAKNSVSALRTKRASV